MYTEEQRIFLWLAENIGAGKAFDRAVPVGADLVSIWAEPEKLKSCLTAAQLSRLLENRSADKLDARIARLDALGARFVTRFDPEFPDPLRMIPDPPALLYVRGALPDVRAHKIAMVGTRRASRDGLEAAKEIARGLSESGVVVVSGLARGIDTAAHTGALEGGSPTVAVLGTGLSTCYPAENAELSEKIVDGGGCLVTEYPPDARTFASNFACRNRLISGFCSGSLLVEGEITSGAMITLRRAAEQGRVRFALPGSIFQANSVAPNALLKDGAQPVVCAGDILAHFGWKACAREKPPAPAPRSGPERAILGLLHTDDLSMTELIEKTGMDAGPLSAALTMMEMKGQIRALPGKMYRKVR